MLLLFTMHATIAQVFEKAKLDEYFASVEASGNFMGSVSVTKNGMEIYSNSLGFADVEKQIANNHETVFRIGSISKTYTTVLVLKAVEEKKLSMSQKLSKFFPDIPNAKKITLAQMLNHRSGIHNFTDDPDYLKWNIDPVTREVLVEIIAAGGSDFEPGKGPAYSNSNFVLLSLILEKAYGKTYSEILEEKIIKPLSLKNTRYGGKINTEKNQAFSYFRKKNKWLPENETDMSIPIGAGAVVSTAVDINIFAEALFTGKLVSDKHLEFMKTITDHYGNGLFQIPFYDKKGFGHTGGIDGFNSVFSYFSSDSVSFSIVSNGLNCNMNDISITVLCAVFGKPFDVPEFKMVELSAEELDVFTGVYSSKKLAMKITVTRDENILVGQATGQPSFELTAIDKNVFENRKAGVVMTFNVKEKSFELKQRGMKFEYLREE